MYRITRNFISRYNKFYCTSSRFEIQETKEYIVPEKPIPSKIDACNLTHKIKIDGDTIALLERLSLVDCENRKGIETLQEALLFADQIHQVSTGDAEPLVTVLEDIALYTAEDIVSEGNIRDDILKNAAYTEDEYFVAPPGNIPLEPRQDLLHEKELNKS